jgi:release factor glutamine methyltransferase
MLKRALAMAREALTAGHIPDAPLESELLLRHVLRLDRVQLYLEPERELPGPQERAFWKLVERRLDGEPAAYITGHKEFYGLDFAVDRRVLVPRPETELLVERALALSKKRTIETIADVGTGCGAVAVSLAVHLPGARVYATDISRDALEVARANCGKHGVLEQVSLLNGNLLAPLPGPVDLIVANLPYVRKSEVEEQGLDKFEPCLSLGGGPDGLDLIRELCRQAREKLAPSGCLMLEIGQGQGRAVTGFLRRLFPSALLDTAPDLAGIERVVALHLTPQHRGATLVG